MGWNRNVHVYRQLFLLTAKCLVSFSSGLSVSFPSVLIPAILSPDAEIKATPDQGSWIVTSFGISGCAGYMFIPLLFEIYGRKLTNVVISFITLIGGLIFYVANDVYSLVFARLIQGLTIGGSFITIMSICECISPKRRGYFMVLYKVSIGVGSLACHSLAFLLNWRQIAVCGALPSFISIILYLLCAESPSFFAKRGEFDECAKAFEWYRGKSVNAKNEMNELITAQKENLRTKQNEAAVGFKRLKKMVLSKEFQKSFYILTLTILCLDTCGRYFLITYITLILTELTKNLTSAMYISIGFDCILIFALSASSVLIKRFNRRTLLFQFGFGTVILMFLVSLSIVLKIILNLPQDTKWLTLGLILIHIFVINVGIVPVAFALTGEIYSLDHRGLGLCISGVLSTIFLTIILKITPIMIAKTGLEGTYSIYGFCLCIFLVLLRCILPETKDKTLQQIEDEMKGVVRSQSMELVAYSKVSNCLDN